MPKLIIMIIVIAMKLDMYVMTPEAVSVAYFITPSHH
jgi:hypothetical protein